METEENGNGNHRTDTGISEARNGTGSTDGRSNPDSGETGFVGNASQFDNEVDGGAGAGSERTGNPVSDTGTGTGSGSRGGGTGRRKPGRPKGSSNKAKPIQASVESQPAKPTTTPRTTNRRSKKISGEHVEKGVVQVFGFVSMVRGPHWKVDKSEVTAWSADAAELLNKIPASTFDRFTHISTGIAVAIGMGSIVVPRAMVDMAIVKQNAALKRVKEEAEKEATTTGAVEMDMAGSQPGHESDIETPANDDFSRMVSGAMGHTAW